MESKAAPGIIHYKSRQDYLSFQKQRGAKVGQAASQLQDGTAIKENVAEKPASKVDLSEKAKEAPTESIKPKTSEKPQIQSKTDKIKNASKKIAKKAMSLGLGNLKPAIDMAKTIAKASSSSLSSSSKTEKTGKEVKAEVKKEEPVVFFFNGFELFADNNGQGLRKLAEHVPHSRLFHWSDEKLALDEIAKFDRKVPIILAGHSLGGDTAVNISQKLNTLENGYRKVDLLVTLDSFGMNNDVIPTNVENNLNFIGDEQSFLNDGPNIAKDISETDVRNELRSESHTDIDGDDEVHKKIYESLMPIITDFEWEKKTASSNSQSSPE